MGWRYFGQPNKGYETGLFITCAVVSGLCLWPTLMLLWRMGMSATSSIIIVPILCVLLCYENIVLACGSTVGMNSAAVLAATATHALLVPLFLVSMFEMAYSVHKNRSVKFCGIVFDVSSTQTQSLCMLYLRRQ
jgi:hypothetical protein